MSALVGLYIHISFEGIWKVKEMLEGLWRWILVKIDSEDKPPSLVERSVKASELQSKVYQKHTT